MSDIDTPRDVAHDVYVTMRRGDVARTETVNAVARIDRDANGGLIGFEILGAIDVEGDGKSALPAPATVQFVVDFEPGLHGPFVSREAADKYARQLLDGDTDSWVVTRVHPPHVETHEPADGASTNG